MYECSLCSKEFKSQKALNAHQVSHKEGPRYTARKEYKNRLQRVLTYCNYCNTEIKDLESRNRKYCNSICQHWHRIEESIKSGNYTATTAITYFKKFTEYKCSCCEINSWQGKPLTLQIDHIDGDNSNNDLSNLRYLCPNCHTQTPTWGVLNAQFMKEKARLV